MSSYAVLVTLAGDASAGMSTITVTPDPQYDSIVSYVGAGVLGGTSDPLPMELEVDTGAETASIAMDVPLSQVTGSTATHSLLWTPPLLLLTGAPGPPSIVAKVANTNGDTQVLNLRMYNFRKGVAQRTPLSVLVAALPRASTAIV